jgi:hypothetical protein
VFSTNATTAFARSIWVRVSARVKTVSCSKLARLLLSSSLGYCPLRVVTVNPTPHPDQTTTPTLVVEQARMLVQAEEARFSSAQSRATTLLALAGVLATLGGAVLTGLDGRDYELVVNLFGVDVSLVLIAVCVAGALAIGALLRGTAIAIGALQKKPDPRPDLLTTVVKDQFPTMLDQEPLDSSRFLLSLLTKRLELVQEAARDVTDAMRTAVRALAVAVVAGLVLSVIVLIGTTAKDHQVYLVKENGENSIAKRGSR